MQHLKPQQDIRRGDWFCTKNNNKGRCWLLRPSDNEPREGPYLGEGGTFLGPVHEADITERFTAILVPHPRMQDLGVWVNVWTSENQYGKEGPVWFCNQVPRTVLENWRRRGWTDFFMS